MDIKKFEDYEKTEQVNEGSKTLTNGTLRYDVHTGLTYENSDGEFVSILADEEDIRKAIDGKTIRKGVNVAMTIN